jgi:hypothetical protein
MRKPVGTKRGIKIIAFVNGIACALHVVFWTYALWHLAHLPATASAGQQIDRIVTAGIGIADLIWSAPLLAIGSWGLPRHSFVGWLGAQAANLLWVYSYTFLLFREFAMRELRPGTMLFLPFALFALGSASYLWRVRGDFLESSHEFHRE